MKTIAALSLLLLATFGCSTSTTLRDAEADAGPVFVLMGEVHDNAEHHRMRAERLRAILADGQPTTVVFEQLERGRDDSIARQRSAAPADIEGLIDAGGFDRRGWQWPLHRPLVAAAMVPNATIVGAQLPREKARQLMRVDESAWPADLLAVLRSTTWPEPRHAAQIALIRSAHCNSLPDSALEPMARAQRVRDAAMALAMYTARRAGARRVVLIAGNGHVDRDLGVPIYLEALGIAPAQIRAIGYGEAGQMLEGRFDARVVSASTQRDDACKAFSRER